MDRTQADIDAKNSKAYFNHNTDYLRIVNNAQIVCQSLAAILGIPTWFSKYTYTSLYTFLKASDFYGLLGSIETLREKAALPIDAGYVKSTEWLGGQSADGITFEDVNLWERTIDNVVNNMGAAASYQISCGVAAVGQPRFYQSRFRGYTWVPLAVSPTRKARCGIAISGAGLKRNNGYRRIS
jgi:hypothetical protein